MSVRKKQRTYNGELRFVYEARWKDPKTGKWPSKTFRTKKEADAYHATMVDQTRRGVFVRDRDTVTFTKAWTAYSDDLEVRCRAGDIGDLTVKGYRAHARRVLPEFGRYKLTEIDHGLVRPYIYRRAAIERWNYVRHDLIVISLVLDFGVRQEWLARNALKNNPIQRPRNARLRHVKEPTVAQVHQLISALARGPEYGDHLVTFYNAKLVVALDTLGLRNGEHCGLQWEDVGFDTGWLTIRHARTRQGVLKAPKSGKSRQLPLPQGVRNALWEHRLRQGSPTTGPVLLARDGKPANPCQISDHYFPFAMRRAGLVDPNGKPNKADELPTLFSSHSLRRFCASYQKRSGVPLDEIQAFLGHSRPDTTQQYIYWQRSIDGSERALGKLTADIGLHRLTDATAPDLIAPGQIEITLPPEPAPSQMRMVRGGNGAMFERPRHRAAILASAVSLLEQGRSIPAIATEIGMSCATLRLWLYHEGICQPRDTSERQALVVSLYREGVDTREICRRVGVSPPSIYQWIKKAGVPMRGRRSPVDYTDRRLLAIELYQQGVPVLEISARCRVSNGCIYEWIKAAGVQHRGRGKWTSTAQPLRPHPQREAAIAMYRAGARVPAIAEQCGVAYRTVFQWLKEDWVPMRMDGGRPKGTLSVRQICGSEPLSD